MTKKQLLELLLQKKSQRQMAVWTRPSRDGFWTVIDGEWQALKPTTIAELTACLQGKESRFSLVEGVEPRQMVGAEPFAIFAVASRTAEKAEQA